MLKILKCCNFHLPKRYFAKKEINIEMKYLNVAEKNDAAKTIAGQLSNGTARRVSLQLHSDIGISNLMIVLIFFLWIARRPLGV